jgi:hypothetical protein
VEKVQADKELHGIRLLNHVYDILHKTGCPIRRELYQEYDVLSRLADAQITLFVRNLSDWIFHYAVRTTDEFFLKKVRDCQTGF